jgi:hypothetical protein
MANRPSTTERQVRQLRALLTKTVVNGATAGEQDASVAKARDLCAKAGLDPADFEWPPLAVEGATGGRTIRAICEAGILAGRTTAEIIALVKAEKGAAVKTSPGCVSWYRSKMVKRGAIPSRRPAPAQ